MSGSANSRTCASARSSSRVVAGSRGKRRLGTAPRAALKSPTVSKLHDDWDALVAWDEMLKKESLT